MKFSVTRDALVEGLAVVSKSVMSRPVLEVLKYVKLEAEGSSLELATTDLEMETVVAYSAKVYEQGTAVVPFRLLRDFVDSLSCEWIDFLWLDDELNLLYEGGEATIKGKNPTDFPQLSDVEGQSVTFPADIFSVLVSRVAFAAARDEARPILTGVHLSGDGKQFTMVAADGFRLSVESRSLVTKPFSVLVPVRALKRVAQLISDTEQIEMIISKQRVAFEMGGITLVTQLVEGNYINYRAVMPTKYKTRVTLLKADLLKALKTAKAYSKVEYDNVRLYVQGDKLFIKVFSTEYGRTETDIDCVSSGEDIEVKLSLKFLVEAIQAARSKEIVMKFGSSIDAMVVEVDDWQHVIMPRQEK